MSELPDAYASQDYQKGWREGRASAEARIEELEAKNEYLNEKLYRVVWRGTDE